MRWRGQRKDILGTFCQYHGRAASFVEQESVEVRIAVPRDDEAGDSENRRIGSEGLLPEDLGRFAVPSCRRIYHERGRYSGFPICGEGNGYIA